MNRMSQSLQSYLEDTPRSKKRKIWIILGVSLVLVVLLIAALAIWIPNKNADSGHNPAQCSAIKDDTEKFDCHPERPIQQDACLARGCCFIPASDLSVKDFDLISSSYLGVPSCFFPPNYEGYKLTKNETRNGNSIVAEFERGGKSSGFEDIKKIALEVIPLDENRLRIKITAPNSNRYVPDVPVLELPSKSEGKENYEVQLKPDGLLEVRRNSTNQVIFRTQISQLIYSEQFLQLSTDIPSKYIYGLGEQKEGILKSTNWARYTLFNQGDLPVPHRNLYGSHPFYIVMEEGGLSSGVFLLNTNAIDYVVQPKPAVTIRTIGGILDFFVLLGPTPGEVVSQYTALFGKPNFTPRWSLGFQICKYGYFTLEHTKEVLERNLKAGIPVDTQWHDIDYMDHHLDFTYDPNNFADLPKFVDKLHDEGRTYIAMISPGVSNSETPGSYAAYDEGKQKDLFVKDTEGNYIEGKVWNDNMTVFPDFSNPQTADYWKARFKDFHSKLNFDGVWLDMNEPLNFLNGSNKGCPNTKFDNPPYVPGRPFPLNTLTLCMSAKHYKTEHYNEHNLLAYRESKATHSAMSEITGKRPFIIARASFSGQAVYSGHWSGDITSNWEDMRYSISAMLAFSLYGMAMTGSDICGFRQNTTEELCRRWQTLGAFYPMSRNHNDYDTIEQDPAAMGPKVIEATKKALHKRYYLIPYLYTLFYRNHIAGETVARPLFFEFPDDKETYAIEDEFLWGPALLVMPALEMGVQEINPYVPKGTWYDMDTYLAKESKGERMKHPAGETDINVAIRGGYILPAQVPGNTTKDSAENPFHLLVALDDRQEAQGELFWDDGASIGTVKNEKYNYVIFIAKKNTLEVIPDKKGYDAAAMNLELIKVFALKDKVSTVTINGGDVDQKWLEYKDNVLTIKMPTDKKYTLKDVLTVEWKF